MKKNLLLVSVMMLGVTFYGFRRWETFRNSAYQSGAQGLLGEPTQPHAPRFVSSPSERANPRQICDGSWKAFTRLVASLSLEGARKYIKENRCFESKEWESLLSEWSGFCAPRPVEHGRPGEKVSYCPDKGYPIRAAFLVLRSRSSLENISDRSELNEMYDVLKAGPGSLDLSVLARVADRLAELDPGDQAVARARLELWFQAWAGPGGAAAQEGIAEKYDDAYEAAKQAGVIEDSSTQELQRMLITGDLANLERIASSNGPLAPLARYYTAWANYRAGSVSESEAQLNEVGTGDPGGAMVRGISEQMTTISSDETQSPFGAPIIEIPPLVDVRASVPATMTSFSGPSGKIVTALRVEP